MASTVEQAAAPNADVVGNAFVHQYYLILPQSPDLVHRFYHDISKLGRPEGDGVMSITTTIQCFHSLINFVEQDIDKKILFLDYEGTRAEITKVDARESYNGGVLVLVTGFLTGKDSRRQKCTQSFFLAPQDKGYFVLNDLFRYVDDEQQQQGNQESAFAVEAPLAPSQDPTPVKENHISEHIAVSSEEITSGELYGPSENDDGTIEEALLPEEVGEVPQVVTAEHNPTNEELTKKAYTSILKVMKEGARLPSTSTPAPSRSLQKSQERPIISPPLPSPVLKTPISISDHGNNQEGEEEGHSIYIKSLPLNATLALLGYEFKKFGPIKSGGIQVRNQKGVCFSFVEFEDANSVQSAIEASLIMIDGRRVVAEEKRSKAVLSAGVNRGRPSGVGYRNEGVRGRGNYHGNRAYGCNYFFNNRNEFGNRSGSRGGFSNRGKNGYQRSDSIGGRANRAGGLSVNEAVKSSASCVSAPA